MAALREFQGLLARAQGLACQLQAARVGRSSVSQAPITSAT